MASAPTFAYHCLQTQARTRLPEPALGAFGEKLRKQREQRGLALDAISNTTKISPRMLRALEEEHFEQLPGGVFNKGFVRAYARQVGLDEEEAVADYLVALRESQIQQHSILPDFRTPAGKPSAASVPHVPRTDLRLNNLPADSLPGNDGSDHPNPLRSEDRRKKEDRRIHHESVVSPDSATRPPAHAPAKRSPEKYPAGSFAQPIAEHSTGIPWGKLAAALLAVTLLLAFWNLRRQPEPKSASLPPASAQKSSNSTADPVPATTPVSPAATANSLTAGNPSPAGTPSIGTAPAGTLSSGTVSGEATSPRPTPTPPSASPFSKAASFPMASTKGSAANQPAATQPSAATNPLPPKTPTAAVKPPPTFTLLIRAEKTTWISVLADGKPVAEETLIAPAHTTIRASHEILVRAGNAAGISFLLKGKEFPAQGLDGEVKTYIFDPTGIRVAP